MIPKAVSRPLTFTLALFLTSTVMLNRQETANTFLLTVFLRTFRGSSALHAVGDSYLLLVRPSAHLAHAVELRFQFRYAAPQPSRLLELDPSTLWFSAAGLAPYSMSIRTAESPT